MHLPCNGNETRMDAKREIRKHQYAIFQQEIFPETAQTSGIDVFKRPPDLLDVFERLLNVS